MTSPGLGSPTTLFDGDLPVRRVPRGAQRSSRTCPRSLPGQREGEATRLIVRPASLDPLPPRHDRLLDRHDSVEVGHEAAVRHSRDEAVVWPSTSLDLVEPQIIHLDQRANLDEGAIRAAPDDVASLSEDREAAHGRLGVLDSFDDRSSAGVGQRVLRARPIQKPSVLDDAVALTPSCDSLVDLLTDGTVNRAHAAGPLRFERRAHAPVPGVRGRPSRRRAGRAGGAYAPSGPLR